MPPSATMSGNKAEYDAAYAQSLMDDVNNANAGQIRRVSIGITAIAIGLFIGKLLPF